MKKDLAHLLVWFLLPAACGKPAAKQNPAHQEVLPAPTVKVMTARRETYVPVIRATGQALPLREVTLSVEQPGKLQYLPAEVGETVLEKRLLARVRSLGLWSRKNQVAAQVQEIETSLAQAESDYRKVKELYDRGAVSARELETAELMFKTRKTQLSAAQAGMSQLDETLYGTSLYAPFTGEIAARYQEVGNFVNMGTPLYKLVDLSTIRAVVGVSELDVKFIQVGDTVWITPLAYPDRGIKGVIHSISPAQDPALGAFPVEIRFPNVLRKTMEQAKSEDLAGVPLQRKWWVLSGMTLRVTISKAPVTAIFVPAEAVVERQGKLWVFAVDPQADAEKAGTATLQEVKLGRTYEGWYEVLAGVQEGQRIIVAGNTKLKDKALVRAHAVEMGINQSLVDVQTSATPAAAPAQTSDMKPAAGEADSPAPAPNAPDAGMPAPANP